MALREVGGGQCHLPGRAQVGLSGPRWSPAQHGSCPVRQAPSAQPQRTPHQRSLSLFEEERTSTRDKRRQDDSLFQERRRKLVEIRRSSAARGSLSWALRCDERGLRQGLLCRRRALLPPEEQAQESGATLVTVGRGHTGEGCQGGKPLELPPPLTSWCTLVGSSIQISGGRAVGTSWRAAAPGLRHRGCESLLGPEPRAGSLVPSGSPTAPPIPCHPQPCVDQASDPDTRRPSALHTTASARRQSGAACDPCRVERTFCGRLRCTRGCAPAPTPRPPAEGSGLAGGGAPPSVKSVRGGAARRSAEALLKPIRAGLDLAGARPGRCVFLQLGPP